MRCPRCGMMNYGDVQKCYNCQLDLRTPIDQVVPLEDKAQKHKSIPRNRIPILMIIGVIVVIISMLAAILPYPLITVESDDALHEYKNGINTKRDNGDTFILSANFKVLNNFTDLKGWYALAVDVSDSELRDMSKYNTYQSFASNYLIKYLDDDKLVVISPYRLTGNLNLKVMVVHDTGTGYDILHVQSITLYPYFLWIPGTFFTLVGIVLFLIGFIGTKDRSLDQYFKQHPELGKGNIKISEYQKQQAEKMASTKNEDIYATNANAPPPGGAPPPGQPPIAPPPGGAPPPGQPPIAPPPGGAPPPGQPPIAPPPEGAPPPGSSSTSGNSNVIELSADSVKTIDIESASSAEGMFSE